MMARRDMPDVVMRFDGLRKSGGSTFLTGCGPQQPDSVRTSTGTFLGATSPYRSVLGAGSPRSQRRPGSSSSRRLGNNVPHAATDQGHSPKKPSFERNVVALSAASRVQATAGLGRDVAEISETDMEEQRAQVLNLCRMLGNIAEVIAKAEQGRSTRVIGDTLKDALVEQKRVVFALRQQIAKLQVHSDRVCKKNKELEVNLAAANRRLQQAQRDLHEMKCKQPQPHATQCHTKAETVKSMHVEDAHTAMSDARQQPVLTSPSDRWELVGTGDGTLHRGDSPAPQSDDVVWGVSTMKERIQGHALFAFWTWDYFEISKLVCSSARVDSVRFIVRNVKTGGLVSSADNIVDGVHGGSIGALFRVPASELASSLAAETAKFGAVIRVSDLAAESRRNKLTDIGPFEDSRTCLLSVPITETINEGGGVKSVVIGVIQVAGKGRDGFDSRTEDDIKTIARYCAEPLAIRLRNEEKIRDFTEQAKEVAQRFVATVAGSYDLALIAPILEQHIQQTVACEFAAVLWLDGAEPTKMMHRMAGASVESVPLQGLTARCMESREELYVADVQSCRGFIQECDSFPHLAYGSLLLIPVLGHGGEAVGVLRLQSQDLGAFDAFQAHSMNTINAIATLGLGSILRNTAGVSRRQRFGQAFHMTEGGSVSPLLRMCQTLHSQILSALGGKVAGVSFYNVDNTQNHVCMILYQEVSNPVQEENLNTAAETKIAQVGIGLCGSTAASGLVSRVVNTSKDRRFDLSVDVPSAALSNMASLWIPLRNLDGQVTGVASVFVENDAAFDGAGGIILRLCHEYGPFFSDLVHLQNVERERKRWRQIAREILPVLDCSEASACANQIKASFVSAFALSQCQIWFFDPQTLQLTHSAGRGASKELTVSMHDQDQLCKSARSGNIFVASHINHELANTASLARKDLRALPKSAGQAQLVVPLMDSSRNPIFVLQAHRTNSFTLEEKEMVEEMSKIGALAMEHSRLLQAQSTVGAKHFEDALTVALTVEEAMHEVIAASCNLCKCSQSVVFWPSPDGNMCQYYLEDDMIKMKMFEEVSPSGIAAECLLGKTPMLMGDSRQHSKFHPGMDGVDCDHERIQGNKHDRTLNKVVMHASAPEPIQAIYCPVISSKQGGAMAVICVRKKKRGAAFNRQDVINLGALARKAALTLSNVEKHEQLLEIARTRDLQRQQMNHLNTIRTMHAEALTSVFNQNPLNSIVARMCDVMCEMVNAEGCKLYVVEEGGNELRKLGEIAGSDKVTTVKKAAESDIACKVLRENESILFDINSLGSERSNVGIDVRSSLTVPLRGELGHVFAILQLQNKRQGTFSGSDELVVHMAASAFKTVLDSSLLSQVRFDVGLGSIENSLETIMMETLEKATSLVAAEAGQVFALVNGGEHLKRCAEITPAGERVGRERNALGKFQSRARNSNLYGSTQGLAGHVAQTKTSMNIPRLNLEDRFDAGIDLKFDFEGEHSFVSCPLLLQTGECMGVIQLVKKGLGQFSEHHIRLLHMVCAQAAMVLRNRTQYEYLLQTSLQHVIHVTESVMWCLKPDKMLPSVDVLVNRITETAINLLPCENAVLLMRNASTNQHLTLCAKEHVWTKIAVNSDHPWPFQRLPNRTAFTGKHEHFHVKIALHNGIVSQSMTSLQPVLVQRPHPHLTHDWSSVAVNEVKNMLVLPILGASQSQSKAAVGMLVMVNKEDLCVEDASKLEHFTAAIGPAVDCIRKCQGWDLPDFLHTMHALHP